MALSKCRRYASIKDRKPSKSPSITVPLAFPLCNSATGLPCTLIGSAASSSTTAALRAPIPTIRLRNVAHCNFAPGTFKDKIVLVGASATGIGDLRTPPYGGISYPGLEVHANVIDNMLNNDFLIRGVHQQLLDLFLIFVFGIPLGIALALVSPRWMWFGLALLIPFAALIYLAFLHGWWLNFTLPAGTLTANVMLVSLYRALVEEEEFRQGALPCR